MKEYQTVILLCYFNFLAGMIVGAALAQKPLLWILTIILTALFAALMVVPWGKSRKKKLTFFRILFAVLKKLFVVL